MSYLTLLKKLGNAGVGDLQNLQNPKKEGSEGFEGTASGGFEKNSAPNNRPANESDAQAQGVFEGRIDILVMYGVIDRQAGAGLVRQHMFWPDVAETRLNRIEVDSRMSKYYGHHFQCSKCISAGRGYGTRCDVGLALWEAKP